MTLLATEIALTPKPMVVFAADRRISKPDGRRHSERRKILPIPAKRACVGYFGAASVPVGRSHRRMDDWLVDFLAASSAAPSFGAMAERLALALNRAFPRGCAYPSGMHLAGLGADGAPEFWFVRNVADDRVTLLKGFSAREDFRRRDAAALGEGAIQIYRNGDIPAHVAAWEALDNTFGGLLSLPGFQLGRWPEGYARWVKFKMETIASFYEKFCVRSVLGRPIDAFVVTEEGVRSVEASRR